MSGNPNLRTSSTGARTKNRLQWVTKATLAGLVLLFLGFGGTAQAGTISFTFSINGTVVVTGVPSDTMLTLPDTITGMGTFSDFGPAMLSETGIVTFLDLGGGVFFPEEINNNVTVSFDGGLVELFAQNHITFGAPGAMGLPFTTASIVTGGTGILTGATGNTLAMGFADPTNLASVPAEFAGTGTVSAPGIPEPVTTWLVAISLAVLAGAAKIRKRA